MVHPTIANVTVKNLSFDKLDKETIDISRWKYPFGVDNVMIKQPLNCHPALISHYKIEDVNYSWIGIDKLAQYHLSLKDTQSGRKWISYSRHGYTTIMR